MVVATCKSTKYTLIAARVISVAAAYAPSVCSLSMQHLKHNSPPVYDTWQLVLTFAVSCFLGLVSFNLLALTSLQQTTHQASGQLPTSADGHAIAAAAIASTRHGVPFKQADHALQIVFESRVCGSPAVDGYAHVNATCLEQAPLARWYREFEAAGGRFEDMVVHLEPAADFDGLAVFWGIGNTKTTAEECAKHCWEHRPHAVGGPFKDFPCNAFAWCSNATCFEPDAHKHSKGDCWLKYTEGPAAPEVNMRGRLSEAAQQRHPAAPPEVTWWAGVLLPPGVKMRNGTWSPRYHW